ncbi:armadillo repeat-containing protein 5 [Heterodontus francisci]|uniref:armadillo repeat-containing protein 5 n=1 Tax=Heterodontus francisci TaxID=7792 RepID=UPI00355AD5CF
MGLSGRWDHSHFPNPSHSDLETQNNRNKAQRARTLELARGFDFLTRPRTERLTFKLQCIYLAPIANSGPSESAAPANQTLCAVSHLIGLLSTTEDAECLQSAVRALRILSDSPAHRQSLTAQGLVGPLVGLLAREEPGLLGAACRAAAELTRSCGAPCALQISRHGGIPRLAALSSHGARPVREGALAALGNLCGQGFVRPSVGAVGGVGLLVAALEGEPSSAGAPAHLRALCLCCREAVNRARVREEGGLELLLALLREPGLAAGHLRILGALLGFFYDQSAMDHLQARGLVPLLAGKLASLVGGLGRGLPHPTSVTMRPPTSPRTSGRPVPATTRRTVSTGWRASRSRPRVPPASSASDRGCYRKVTSRAPVRCPRVDAGLARQRAPSCRRSGPTMRGRLRVRRSEQAGRRRGSAAQAWWCPCPPPRGPRRPPPEPSGPEAPILLLLSRFSQAEDPAPGLVTERSLRAFLDYLTVARLPSPRCARLLARLACNPNCLEALVRARAVALVRAQLVHGLRPGAPSEPMETTGGGRGWAPTRRNRELGELLLRNLSVQAESPFGAGALTHLLLSGSESEKEACAIALPLLCRNESLRRRLLLDHGGLHLLLETLLTSEDPVATFGAADAVAWMVSAAGEGLEPTPKRPRLEEEGEGAEGTARCRYQELAGPGAADVHFVLDGGERLAAARGHLTRGSEVFAAMLEGGYLESRQSEVPLRGLPLDVCSLVLHYLHGCRPGCPAFAALGREEGDGLPFQDSLMGRTLSAAGQFLLGGLGTQLEEAACAGRSPGQLPALYHFAERHHFPGLRARCLRGLLGSAAGAQEKVEAWRRLAAGAGDLRALLSALRALLLEHV